MFSEEIGAKGGKKDLALTRKNKQRKKKIIQQEQEEKQVLEKKKIQEQNKQVTTNNVAKKQRTTNRIKKAGTVPDSKKELSSQQPLKSKEEIKPIPSKVNDQEIEKNKQEYQSQKEKNLIENQEPEKITSNKKERKVSKENKARKVVLAPKEATNSLENDFSDTKNTSSTIQEKSIPQEENPLWELKVIQELENLIKENQYQLDKLFAEYYLLEKEVDAVQYSEDSQYLSQEIEKLLDQLERIKRELEVLVDTIDLENIYQLHDDYLTYLVENYKQQVSKDMIIKQVEDFKHDPEYLSIMKKIILFEQARNELEEQVKDKQYELDLRDQEFEQLKTECLEIEKTTTLLQQLIDDANRALIDIQAKVAETVHVSENVKTRLKSSLSLMAQILLMIALLKKKPFKQSIGLMAVEGILAANILKELLNPKEIKEITLTSDIKDYQDEIISAINDVGAVTDLVEKSLVDIQEVRKNFEQDFRIYQDLAEYKELLTMMLDMEEELTANKEKIVFVQQEMARELEKNDQKVKRYENLAA